MVKRTGASLLLLLGGFSSLFAQLDSALIAHPLPADTALRPINWNTPAARTPFPYKKMLLPATFVVYGVLALKTDGLQDWNEALHDEFIEHPHKPIHLDNYLQWGPAATVYALNLAGVKGKHDFKDRTIMFGMSEIMMSSVVFTVKKISHEWRPDGSDQLSFPSGHTANAFAGAEFLRQEYKDVSPWYCVAGYLMAGATGYLRMYNNKHWLGDVVAGAGVGIISTDVAYYLYPFIKRKLFKNHSVSTMIMPTYSNGSIGAGLVHAF